MPKIQIVNEQNEVIGSEDKQIAHEQGLWHRIVCVYVFNDQGQLFIQQRNVVTDSRPHLWDHSSAGHVDEGEEPLTAAHRELKEELGIEAELKFISNFSTQHLSGSKKLNRFWYLYQTKHNGPFVLQPDEIIDGKFVDLDSLLLEMKNEPNKFVTGFHNTIDRYLSL